MQEQKNDQIKRQICEIFGEDRTWKKYIFIENDIVVEEKFVRIVNGIEILSEEPREGSYLLELPANFENQKNVSIKNIETGEIKSIEINQHNHSKKVEVVKIFNETQNIGTRTHLENGIQVSLQYYKIEKGKETICDSPINERFYFIPLPDGCTEFSSYNGDLSMLDASNGEIIRKIPKSNFIQINNKTEIKIKDQNDEVSKEMISKITELSNDGKEKFINNIQKTCEPVTNLEGRQVFTSTIDQVAETIGNLIHEIEEIPSDFYKTVDPKNEFGISRVVADKVYNLPKILENAMLVRQGETTTYIIQAEAKDSYGNSIRLEHRLQATSPQEAQRIGQIVLKKLKGIQLKIWVACWKMANTKARLTFSCRLTDLMKCSNPSRTAHFNSGEKLEFYENLRSLENTKFVYTKSYKYKGKDKVESYEIRLLEIHRRSGDRNDETPQELTMTVLNAPALQKQKTTFVGVGVKNKTLELHADDTMLASIVQTRKNQNMGSAYIRFKRDSLIETAGLSGTNKRNKAEANKLLLGKLERLWEKNIILTCPKRINDNISLKVR
jgi:hypothetical protein